MYEGIDSVQQFADKVKSVILDMARLPKGRRMDGLRAVSDLERCGWHPAMMTDAVRDVVGETDDGWAFLDGDDATVLTNIESVIRRYLSIYGCESGDILEQIYDTQEASEYLGITMNTMKYHISRKGNLQGVMKGRTMLFTRAQLDAFKKEYMRG